jgi:hypothetical protein
VITGRPITIGATFVAEALDLMELPDCGVRLRLLAAASTAAPACRSGHLLADSVRWATSSGTPVRTDLRIYDGSGRCSAGASVPALRRGLCLDHNFEVLKSKTRQATCGESTRAS